MTQQYVPFTSNHLRRCSTNISLFLARRVCTILENDDIKEKHFKELKRTLLEQKYFKSLIEASILRAKEIPLEVSRQPKTTRKRELFLSLWRITPTIQMFFL